MITIGFVLLTHSNPDQILLLTNTLNELYDAPPIVCHHDFGQCAFDKQRMPSNVRFVEPHFPTFWGCFSIVPAAVAAVRLLVDGKRPPDWIYLLSGSDYPATSPDKVVSELERTEYDAFIDYREVTYRAARAQESEEALTGFARPSYLSIAYRRYRAVAIPRPSLKKPWALPPVGRSYLHHPLWRSLVGSPFYKNFRCYAGEHWFTVNSKAANMLHTETEQSTSLLAHLRHRESPEECFYHSVLGNSPLNLSKNNLRYIDWPSPDAWHPKTLTLADLPAITASGAHFARKVSCGSPLVAELDRLAGVTRHGVAR